MNKSTEKKTFVKYLIIGMIAPALILYIAFTIIGAGAFGFRSILIGDMYNQYANFYSLYKSILSSGDFSQLLYSWKLSLGGGFIGIFAYYLASPLSFLVLLFPKSDMQNFMMTLLLIKVALSSLTFIIFIKYMYKKINIYTVFFSTMYALMGYVVMYYLNIMWLDGVILLPLVLIGVEKLIKEKKKTFFIVFLAIMILDNFYISYMVGGFALLYFLSRYFTENKVTDWKKFIKALARFLFSAVVAALISGILVVPTYFAIKNTGTQIYLSNPINIFNFNLFLSKFFAGTYETISYGQPNIYIGLIPLILLIPYFFNKKISQKEKIISLLMYVGMFISFTVPIVDLAWQGFETPIWYMFRFSFVYSFMMLSYAYKEFVNIKYSSNKSIIISGVILICILVYLLFTYVGAGGMLVIAGNIVMVIIYVVLLYLYKNRPDLKKNVSIFMIIMIFGELTLSSALYISDINGDVGSIGSKVYSNIISSQPLVNEIKEKDTSFYRMAEVDGRYNRGMALDYNNIASFTSFTYQPLGEFLHYDLGLGNAGVNLATTYSGTTAILNSLLGVKYVMANNYLGDLYTEVAEGYGKVINEYKYSLPIGYVVNSGFMDKNIDFTSNMFVNNNLFLNSMLGNEINTANYKEYLEPADSDYTISLRNAQIVADGESKLAVEKINDKETGVLTFNIMNAKNQELYMDLNDGIQRAVYLYVNGKKISTYGGSWNNGIMSLGYFKAGENVTVQLELVDNDFIISHIQFYGLNVSTFAKSIDTLKNNSIKDLEVTNTQITGTVTAQGNNNILFLSIPYDSGWSAYINGKKVKILSKYNFMEIKLNQGTQNIKLVFIPDGIYKGAGLTIIGVCILMLIIISERKKYKNN